MVVVNAKAFDRLPEEAQKALEDAAEVAEKRGWEASKAETEAKIKIMQDNGIEVSEPSPELVKHLQKIGETMTEEWLDRAGESGQALLDAYSEQ